MKQAIGADKYFHCQGDNCKSKSKKCSKLIFFKGKFLCFHCKLKASKCLTDIPKLNVADNTLKKYVKLKDVGIDYKEVRKLPREHYKDYAKVTPELKAWAERKESNNISPQGKVMLPDDINKVFCVTLTKYERQRLWTHFFKQGLDDLQILKEITKIEDQIKISHKQYKEGLKTEKSFKEEFEKMVNK